MEIKLSNSIASTLLAASGIFFKGRNFATKQDTFFKLFHCWSLSDCNQGIDLSDSQFAIFCDELMELVSATYLVDQANKDRLDNGGRTHA